MLRMPEFPHGSYGYLDGRISHMLNEPTIGGISNNVAEYGHAITVGLEGLRAEVTSRLVERGEEEEARAFWKNQLLLIDELEAFADPHPRRGGGAGQRDGPPHLFQNSAAGRGELFGGAAVFEVPQLRAAL